MTAAAAGPAEAGKMWQVGSIGSGSGTDQCCGDAEADDQLEEPGRGSAFHSDAANRPTSARYPAR
ncbi:hypothetical protein Kisp02_51840 [Kineosporia sp. NBRC 101731]|nr:hypothetical protein Kisp02_51840 [Kineosporia sp. NBRC 101731]